MGDTLTPEIRAEALARGYSRRQFGRIAGVLSMSSAFARFVSAAHASGGGFEKPSGFEGSSVIPSLLR
ncbi:hypothetical protein J4P41_11990 [Gluconobacter sp. NFX36]|uniref:hypothetical protein n=1 Tax=Gluconobacter sp. NFX36 TaxID=2819535 RepID=UPI003CF0FBD6